MKMKVMIMKKLNQIKRKNRNYFNFNNINYVFYFNIYCFILSF